MASQRTKDYAALAAITLCALGARIYLAWQPIETITAKLTPDDAYYYLQLARNIVHGHGPSLDGVNATNGFHPLWLGMLLPLALLGRATFLHAALTFGAVLSAGSIVAFWWAASSLTNRPSVRITATSLYAFNPSILYTAVNGMESSLSLLLLTILFGLALRSRDRSTADYRFWLLLGAVAGLAVLARTDNGLFALAILAALPLLRGFDLRPSLLAASCAAAVTSPWFLWNLVEFGTLKQSSGEGPPLALHVAFDPIGARSRADILIHGAAQLKYGFLVEVPEAYFFARPTLAVLVCSLLFGTVFALAQSAEARRFLIRHAPLIIPASIGALLLIGVHAGYRWFMQKWYFVPVVPLAGLWVALALEAISIWWADYCRLHRAKYPAVVPSLLVLALVLSAQTYASLQRWNPGSYVWQRDMLAASFWLHDNSPEDAQVAGMNVGTVAYFSSRRTTNLDGVVNNRSLEAMKKRQLLAYLDTVHPTYVVDFDVYLFGLFRPFWGGDIQSRLTLITEFDANGLLAFRIYRYQPP